MAIKWVWPDQARTEDQLIGGLKRSMKGTGTSWMPASRKTRLSMGECGIISNTGMDAIAKCIKQFFGEHCL